MIHPTAIISKNSIIGNNVSIGAFSIINDDVFIGDDTVIASFCEIGLPTTLANKKELKIGKGSIIRSHAVIYIGSIIGENLNTGHYITIRENSVIGEHVQIGSRGDIQGDCTIGRYTKMHADVHIGKASIVGNYVWLFSEVLLTNDPTPPSNQLVGVEVCDFSVLAAKVLVLPGVKIGKDAVVAAGSVVKNNVTEGKVCSGNPAKTICSANILRCYGNPKEKAYPWKNRFHRGYSEEDVLQWIKEANEVGK